MAVTAVNSKIAAFNTIKAVTSNAATADVADTAEVVTVTPTSADYKTVIRFYNKDAADMTVTIPAGDQYGSESDLELTIEQGIAIVEVEAGRFMKDGAYAMTLTPGTGKKLLTDHAATVEVLESL